MRIRTRIFLVASLVLCLAACSKEGPKVIPEAKLSRIYADMFLADRKIDLAEVSRKADTMLVYEPILNSYGYTTEDLRASMYHYMGKPSDYEKLLQNAHKMLGKRLSALEKQAKIHQKERAGQNKVDSLLFKNVYKVDPKETRVDTIVLELNQDNVYERVVVVADSIYIGPLKLVREKEEEEEKEPSEVKENKGDSKSADKNLNKVDLPKLRDGGKVRNRGLKIKEEVLALPEKAVEE